ncbi:hypothetical protein BGX24_002149 [Mortierella sp. AD032]|nr:hypothetical protein BGX24_002149 [Mortierella sp. AD032]
MRLSTTLLSVASAIVFAISADAINNPVVAGYLLLNPTNGAAKLKALADNAANIPVNRIFLSFARPDLKAQVAKLTAGGVEVFLSMGGWNYGCFPYVYTYYSVGGYGTTTPNYYKILENGGSLAACTEANMWCYTCEPKSEGTVLADFDIFPEPSNSSTWQSALTYVKANAKGDAPVFHPEMVPGTQWTDPKNQKVNLVPGDGYYAKVNRNPYQDLVHLGKELGLTGVDVDYEEMWHADFYKNGPAAGPWTNHQTVYKYAAIMQDVRINIQAIAPNLLLATAASAAGGLSTNWWGGNLKNIWYYTYKWYPDLYNFIATTGGVNVMTYDLSNNQQYSECPDANTCSLSQQVNYYMKSYADNGMLAHVGYEIGTPAYPDYNHDAAHQLPLIQSELTSILAVQGAKGGFFWELYKGIGKQPNNVEVSSVAQQICKAALGANTPRCAGSIPQPGGSTVTVSPTPTPTGPVTTAPTIPVTTPTNPTTTTPGTGQCTLPAWSASTAYSGGAKVSYNGRQYTAQWWTQGNVPSSGSPWADNGACSGGPTQTPTPGSCGGSSAWASSTAYNSGAKVTYGGFLYTAQWWTQGDTPGSGSVWVKGAACSAVLRRRLFR